MKIYCKECRIEILEIPDFKPNPELVSFLILFKCPKCNAVRVGEINIKKDEVMKKNNLQIWKEKLQDDLYFTVNIKLYMTTYRAETNGIPVRKGDFTKPFIQWLLEQPTGEILIEEMNKRRKDKTKLL